MALTSPLPMPQWVANLTNLTPLLLGAAGILIGRKTKTATDQIHKKEVLTRLAALEKTQAGHVIAIATLQATVQSIQQQTDRIEESCGENIAVTMEMRGMLCQALGIQPIPLQLKTHRPRPVVSAQVVATVQSVVDPQTP